MNSVFGVQRCDVCALYPEDEAAAQALAKLLVPGAGAQRTHFEPFDYGIYMDCKLVDLERVSATIRDKHGACFARAR